MVEQDKVNQNKVVWFYGVPTAGKSWSADFCAKYHDWIHIDGDEVLMRMDPEKYHMWAGLLDSFENYIQQGKVAPPETFGPFLQDRIEETKKARAENPDKTVAVAFALYNKVMRDFVRENSNEPVTFVEIAVKDKAEVTRRNMPRVAAFCAAAGKTEEEAYNMWGCAEKFGPYEEGAWQRVFCEWDPFAGFETAKGADDADVLFIDSGDRSAGTIPGLEKVLNLPHIENPDVKAVAQINNDRGGYSISQKEPIEKAWKTKIDKRLEASAFLGGEAPNDEDFHAYFLMTGFFDKKENMKQNITVTEENYPAIFKWLAVMAEKKKD